MRRMAHPERQRAIREGEALLKMGAARPTHRVRGWVTRRVGPASVSMSSARRRTCPSTRRSTRLRTSDRWRTGSSGGGMGTAAERRVSPSREIKQDGSQVVKAADLYPA